MRSSNLTTELRNPDSQRIDTFSAAEIVALMNAEDAKVATAVAGEQANIAQAITRIAESLRQGGRLFYLGAGTSGRLGVLDASECPPTFRTPPELVVGLIAGGNVALTNAVEGAEDDPHQARHDLQRHQFSARDALVGIATSGRTPYVLGGLRYARSIGAFTIGFTCNEASEIHAAADIVIAPIVGPEVISGSTRLKAGTATKMVLNMLTTGTMVLLGKTYGNWMVDLKASNSKLKLRSVRMVMEIAGVTAEEAQQALDKCDSEVKTAIVYLKRQVVASVAREILAACDGRLRQAMVADKRESQ